ncbi:MAG TPA: hypothetical protein VE219_04300 [Candidatus Sulfotelmatobacter sp.]|nr:hypothetical protein [Candidatus Sulfotelmatobacter sp.]
MSAATAVESPPGRLHEALRALPLRQRSWWSRAAWVELGVYAAAAVALYWPVSVHPTTEIPGAGDSEYYLWQGWRLADLIRHGHILPTFIPDVVWPFGSDLRLSDGYLPSYVGALWNLVASPILANNLALLTAYGLGIWAMRSLARLVSKRRAVWIVTALAGVTAPCVFIHGSAGSHFALAFAFPVPLLIAEALRTIRRGGGVRWIRSGLLLYLAYLSSIYYLIFAAIAFGVIVLIGSARWRPLAMEGFRLAGAAALCLALMLPFLVPRLQLDHAEHNAGAPPLAATEAYQFSGDGAGLISVPKLPGERLDALSLWPLFNRIPTYALETVLFPGFLLLIGLGGFLLLRSRLRWPLAVAALVVWLLALGPTLELLGRIPFSTGDTPAGFLPYDWLLHLPGLNSLHVPGRAAFALPAVLAAMLAIALDWWLGRRAMTAPLRAATLAVAGLLVASNPVEILAVSTWGASPAIQSALAALPAASRHGDSLLHVPADCDPYSEVSVKLQYFHHLPMVGCQANSASIAWYSGLDRYANSRGYASLRCRPDVLGRRLTPQWPRQLPLRDDDLEELHADLGVRYLLVDQAELAQLSWCPVRQNVPALRSHRVIAEDQAWILIDIEGRS